MHEELPIWWPECMGDTHGTPMLHLCELNHSSHAHAHTHTRSHTHTHTQQHCCMCVMCAVGGSLDIFKESQRPHLLFYFVIKGLLIRQYRTNNATRRRKCLGRVNFQVHNRTQVLSFSLNLRFTVASPSLTVACVESVFWFVLSGLLWEHGSVSDFVEEDSLPL